MQYRINILILGALFLTNVTFSQGTYAEEKYSLLGSWGAIYKKAIIKDAWQEQNFWATFDSSGKLYFASQVNSFISTWGHVTETKGIITKEIHNYQLNWHKPNVVELFIYTNGALNSKGTITFDSPYNYRYQLEDGTYIHYTKIDFEPKKWEYRDKTSPNSLLNNNSGNTNSDSGERIIDYPPGPFCCGGTGRVNCHQCSGTGRVTVTKLNPYTNQYENIIENCNYCYGGGKVACPTPQKCKKGKTGF